MSRFHCVFCSFNKKIFAVACFWLLGLISGAAVAWKTAIIHTSLTQSLYYSDLSVVGFLAMLIFPYLLSAVLFRTSIGKCVFLLILIKAYSFSWSSVTFLLTFGCAGWLFRLLFMFSSCLTSVLLLWYWIRNFSNDRKGKKSDLFLCLVLTLIIGFIDFSIISPLGVRLLSYF